eukprot:NODE_9030_length_1451_cov_13.683535.p1 GENE.NODE_9030_length_1451_cov_13.683535~~NODE_9030_length_1451_cov_13.683535.p1  ORF type:complete len:369 (+),score=73.52 NODE_9030_length_1451_cov_13.683535:204-1310(+)
MGSSPPIFFAYIEFVFTLIFVTELLFRVCAARSCFLHWHDKDFYWNVLDVVLVVLALTELVASRISVVPNTTVGRLLRLLRLARILRVVRTARLFHELRALIGGICGSMTQCFWCLVFLGIVMFLCSALLLQLLLDERQNGDGSMDGFIDDKFGDVVGSMYTLFLSVTSGMDWGDVSNPLLEVGLLPCLIFVCYVGFVMLCLLNVVTGLFVENVSMCMQRDLDYMHMSDASQHMELIDTITRLFVAADQDGDGTVDVHEFKSHLEDRIVQSFLRKRLGIDLDAVELDTLFLFLDQDGDGSISLDEFVDGLAHVSGPARQMDLLRLERLMKRCMSTQLKDPSVRGDSEASSNEITCSTDPPLGNVPIMF